MVAEQPAVATEMIPASRVGELMNTIEGKNKAIESLFDQVKTLQASNAALIKKHDTMSTEYAALLSEHSAIKAEVDAMTIKLFKIQNSSPETVTK